MVTAIPSTDYSHPVPSPSGGETESAEGQICDEGTQWGCARLATGHEEGMVQGDSWVFVLGA